MLALVLHLGGVDECVRLIWEWSVHNQESGDLHPPFSATSPPFSGVPWQQSIIIMPTTELFVVDSAGVM